MDNRGGKKRLALWQSAEAELLEVFNPRETGILRMVMDVENGKKGNPEKEQPGWLDVGWGSTEMQTLVPVGKVLVTEP